MRYGRSEGETVKSTKVQGLLPCVEAFRLACLLFIRFSCHSVAEGLDEIYEQVETLLIGERGVLRRRRALEVEELADDVAASDVLARFAAGS